MTEQRPFRTSPRLDKPGRLVILLLLAAAFALVPAVAASGCGTAGGGGTGPGSTGPGTTGPSVTTPSTSVPGGSSTTTLGGIAHPAGKNELILQITLGGGFIRPEVSLYPIPEFSLYGDGRVIVTGPTIAIYPPAALPNLQTTVVSEEVVQLILEASKKAGLFDPSIDYGRPGVTDVGTTTFALNADGHSFQTVVYALGFGSQAGGLTQPQVEARTALQDLSARLADLSGFTSGQVTWTPYDFTGIAVYSSPTQPGTTDSAGVQPNRLDWPLGDLGTLGTAANDNLRRAVVSGQDLAVLTPLLDQATSITLWKSGQNYYQLFFRPLLPDQTA